MPSSSPRRATCWPAPAGQDRQAAGTPRTGKVVRTLEGHTDIVRAVAFSPDQKTLATCQRR